MSVLLHSAFSASTAAASIKNQYKGDKAMRFKLTIIGATLVAYGAVTGLPATAEQTTSTPASSTLTAGPISTPPTGVSTKGVMVGANGTQVSLVRVSSPVVSVKATGPVVAPAITTSTFKSGDNGCSVNDDPSAGTLNRVIVMVLQAKASAQVYGDVRYTTTDPATGLATAEQLFLFGRDGKVITAPPTQSLSVPVTVCIT